MMVVKMEYSILIALLFSLTAQHIHRTIAWKKLLAK